MHPHALAVGDGFGGMAGAVQVGGVNGGERYVRKAVGHAIQLGGRAMGQQGIILPVAAAVNVAFRFGVAYQIKGCHSNTPPESAEAFSM